MTVRGARGTESTRDAIMAAAVEVAARQGITGASMDEIADVAGVAKGSLYYNFESKDAIFEELVLSALERLADRLRDARAEHRGVDALSVMVDTTLQQLELNPLLAKILVSELFRGDRSWAAALDVGRRRIVAEYAGALGESLTGGSASGGGAADAIREVQGAGAFGLVLLAGLDWILFHHDLPRSSVVTSLSELLPGRATA